MPSSSFLISKMLESIDFKSAKVIVEYGPGNGIITKQILDKMNTDAMLICFEINDEFYNYLNKIEDKRLVLLNVSAEHIIEVLKKHDICKVDYFISSLPLTIIPNNIGENILKNSKNVLKKGGYFIQYQYSLSFYRKLKEIFMKKNVSLNFEIKNMPPAFIYKCVKE